MKKVLITGGAGFIGSHLIEHLINLGFSVRVIDNLSTGSINNINKAINQIDFIKEDVANYSKIAEIIEGSDYVVHLAAISSVHFSIEHPLETHKINVDATLNLLNLSKEVGIKKFIFASSSAVYGKKPEKQISERASASPLSPYAVSKLAGEYYSKIYSDLYGLPTFSLRLFNVYGPRQNPYSEYAAVIPKFIGALLEGKPPVIFGDGKQTRDFIFVKDVVEIIGNILLSSVEGSLVMNVGTGDKRSVLEVFDIIREIIDVRVRPIFSPSRKGDIRHSTANIDSLSRIFGFKVRYSFYEGLRETIESFRDNNA